MQRSPRQRTYILFAILAIYVVLQFVWWAVLLVRKDQAIERLGREVQALSGTAVTSATPARGMHMIVGEGIVLLVIVLAILYLTLRAIRRDLSVARSQRNFLLAVTHELRTPIAAIKLQMQTLGRQGLSEEVREHLRVQAVQEADRLAQLTDKVLQATSAEEGRHEQVLDRIDVMDLLRHLVERARVQLAPSHRLVLEGPEQMEILTDAESIRTIVENLIDNAAKYSPQGTTITLEVNRKREGWRLLVCDDGPGVAEEERERIFEKFYRSGNEETRRAKGTGLGLYIVQRLTERLGGAASVKAGEKGGSIFVASFPMIDGEDQGGTPHPGRLGHWGG
jgi:two-component system, OmpR family, sensor histidine kinase CiaH